MGRGGRQEHGERPVAQREVLLPAPALEGVYPAAPPEGVEQADEDGESVRQRPVGQSPLQLLHGHLGVVVARAPRQPRVGAHLHLHVVDRAVPVPHVDVEPHRLRGGPGVDRVLPANVLDALDLYAQHGLQDLPAQLLVEHRLAEHEVVRDGEALPRTRPIHAGHTGPLVLAYMRGTRARAPPKPYERFG